MATVLVTGGTGLIGKRLCEKLKLAGYDVAVLSQVRYNKSDFPVFYWNWQKQEIDEIALKNSDFIIHLAGANIAGQRWSESRKKLIVDSRVESTEFLQSKIKELNISPKAFITASAVGYYGAITTKKVFKEINSPGTDFLATTCKLWEEAASNVFDPRIRTVQLRTGIVLTSTGGAIEKIIKPIKFGIGAILGSGKQAMPWIHVDDLCDMYIKAIQDVRLNGVYNAAAPDFQSNKTLTKALAKVVNKRIWLPNVPNFILKIIYGEMAVMLLYGSQVSSEKILNTGFEFKYPKLKEALKQLNLK